MNHRDTSFDGGVVEQVASREVVGAVDDYVVAVDDPHHILGRKSGMMSNDRHVGVERLDGGLRRVDLALTHPVEAMDDLSLQIRFVDNIHVDDPDRANTCRCEVKRSRRTQAACTEEQHLCVEQRKLPLLSYLGK